MSYDLVFWRYSDEGTPRTHADHLAIYTANGTEGLEPLPKGEVESALHSAMPEDWVFDDESAWVRETGGTIQIYWSSPCMVLFHLYGKWSGGDANRLIGVMNGFGCPLFDPQIPERFQP
ncbi:MAG: hypothetical protein LJE62_10270 [Silicimonas sp.]|nr:hypothetical protein [Silicimonas sp.]